MPTLINDIQLRSHVLDFSSSGQGAFNATSVCFDGYEFINALELIEISDCVFQTQLCRSCGIWGCEAGNWVSLRKFGEYYLFIPAIEEMLEGKWERSNYTPPSSLYKYGVPALSHQVYLDLKKKVAALPNPDKVPSLKNIELLAVLQIEAPGGVLGQLGYEASFERDIIIASADERELSDLILDFESAIRTTQSNADKTSNPISSKEVEFFLDLPSFLSWKPMAYIANKPHLYLEFKTQSSITRK